MDFQKENIQEMFNMFLYTIPYPYIPYLPFFVFPGVNQTKKGLRWPLVNVTVELLLIKCGPWV